jgi:hypothetical protein
MSDSRIVTMRKSANINPGLVAFPLGFIGPYFGFSLESILRVLHSDIYLGQLPNTFPNTIQEYFLTLEGMPGERPWVAMGTLTNGVYFLFTAYMTRPLGTFINNGHMNLWVSTRFGDLIHFAMDTPLYNAYLRNTDDGIVII